MAAEILVKEFDSGDTGQLGADMVAVRLKGEQDGPTLVLLICKSGDRIKTRYALETGSLPMGISRRDVTVLIPEKLKGSLPAIEKIEKIEAEMSSEA